MGCDIHTYREKFVGGKWLTADPWVPYDYGEDDKGMEIPYDKVAFRDRNYNLFGLLAGVRRELPQSLPQRGIPWDACDEVRDASEIWDSDGHSHSYLYLHELRSLAAMAKVSTVEITGMKRRDELAKLRASIASGKPDWKLLYPYCQMTNDPNQDEFEVEAPMEFILGDGLEKLIASFDGIEGENHRLVFWFDN